MTPLASRARIVLATCREYPEGSVDDAGLAAALEDVGCRACWAGWDDGSTDWSGADVVVLRSTWDYTEHRPQFLDWAAGLRSVCNPADVVRWNSDKVYLNDLAAAGVPVVPTVFVPPDSADPLDGMTWHEVVVKPTVSAGSRGTGRFGLRSDLEAVRAHLRALHAAGLTAMVQPFLPVDRYGETSMIFLDGRFSHAVRRASMLPPGQVHAIAGRDPSFDIGAIETVEPGEAERVAAEAALAAIPTRPPLLYARVDLMPGPDGPVVNEVEVIEPGLFLSAAAGATERFARAIAARARPADAVGDRTDRSPE